MKMGAGMAKFICKEEMEKSNSAALRMHLGNILKVKAPLLAYNSFVEAIFVLNDCNAHTGHANSGNSQKESRIFSIRGNDEKSRVQRMHIYVSLLKQMAPEHLLATFAKNEIKFLDFLMFVDVVGKNIYVASVQKLQELNNAVLVFTVPTKLTKEELSNFQENYE